jgi:hypothetical protein
MNEQIEKVIRQLHPNAQASEIIADIHKIQSDEILELDRLREENPRLRAALIDAQDFIQIVSPGEEDDIEMMACIERLSGRITAALAQPRDS